jgi:hypothetical protein
MVGGEELLISRTKPRKDGSVSYFFAAKHRWAKKQGVRAAINEAFEGLERAGLTGRVIEATAVLDGRAQAGEGAREEPGEREDREYMEADAACDVETYDLTHVTHPEVVQAVLSNAIPRRKPSEPIVHVTEAEDFDIQAGGRGMPLEEAVARYPEAGRVAARILDKIGASKSEREMYERGATSLSEHTLNELEHGLDKAIEAAPAAIEAANALLGDGLLQRAMFNGMGYGSDATRITADAAPVTEAGLELDESMAALQAEIDAFNEGVTPPKIFTLDLEGVEPRVIPVQQLLEERGRRLPIARESAPEPRLLQIQEPHEGDTVGIDLETAGPGGAIQALVGDAVVPLDQEAEDLEFLLRGFEPDPEDAPAKPQRAKRKGAGVPAPLDAERPPEASKGADLGSIMDDLGLDD